ncbi:MAG: hypothetical protein ACXVFT_20990 [Solirubrobacteraceae bacterium]
MRAPRRPIVTAAAGALAVAGGSTLADAHDGGGNGGDHRGKHHGNGDHGQHNGNAVPRATPSSTRRSPRRPRAGAWRRPC